MTTTYMSLDLPTVSVTLGPAWATKINTAITTIDSHNHAPGFGALIPATGLALSADVSFNYSGSTTGNNATGLRTTRFVSQSAKPANSADKQCLYVRDAQGNLYFIDGGGNDVKITSGGSLNSAALTNNSYTHTLISIDTTILSSDPYVVYYVDTTAAQVNITLPLSAAMDGKFLKVKHVKGTNPVRILPGVGDQFDNGLAAGSVWIYPGYGAVTFYADGVTYWYTELDGHALNGAITSTNVYTGNSLVVGNIPIASSTTKFTYGPLDLTGGGTGSSNYYTGRLPSANMFQATAGVEGIVKLAGDLGGDGTASTTPRVGTITGIGGVLSLAATAAHIHWADGTASPELGIANAAAGAGANLIIHAQKAGTIASAGGRVTIQSGSDQTASESNSRGIRFSVGTLDKFDITSPGSGTAKLGVTPLTGAGSATVAALFAGQDGSGGGNNGGNVTIQGGASGGGAGVAGTTFVGIGNGSLQGSPLTSTRNAVGLCTGSQLTTTNVPQGDGVIFIANAATPPDPGGAGGKPVGGGMLFVSAGALYWKGPTTAIPALIAAA